MTLYNLTTLPNELSLLTCVFSWVGACVEGVVVVVVVVLAAGAAGAGCDGVDAGAGFSSCCLGASGFFSVGVDADVLDPAVDDVVFGLNDDVSLSLFLHRIPSYLGYHNDQKVFFTDIVFFDLLIVSQDLAYNPVDKHPGPMIYVWYSPENISFCCETACP